MIERNAMMLERIRGSIDERGGFAQWMKRTQWCGRWVGARLDLREQLLRGPDSAKLATPVKRHRGRGLIGWSQLTNE